MASMIRRFAWCGTNAASSVGSTPARSQAFLATGCSAVVAQRNTACPSCVRNELRSLMQILSAMAPSLPHTTGPMPGPACGSVTGPDHGRARAVGEDDAGRAVRPVHPLGELLGADHQHVPGRARPDRVAGRRERVAEPGAGRVQVVGARRDDAQPGRHGGGGVGDRASRRCRWPRSPGRCRRRTGRWRPAPCRPRRRPCRRGSRPGRRSACWRSPTRLRIHSSVVSTVAASSSLVSTRGGLVAAEREDPGARAGLGQSHAVACLSAACRGLTRPPPAAAGPAAGRR